MTNLAILVLASALLVGDAEQAENEEQQPGQETPSPVQLDTRAVEERRHLRALDPLFQRDSPEARQAAYLYLAALDANGLLGLLCELAEDDRIGTQASVLVPFLEKRWRAEKPSYADLEAMMLDESLNSEFRAVLFDLVPKIAGLTEQEETRFLSAILSAAKNTEDDHQLQAYALLQIRPKLVDGRDGPADRDTIEVVAELLALLREEDTDPDVKAAAITTLGRLESEELGVLINDVLRAPDGREETVVRHAILAAGKSHYGREYVGEIERIAAETESDVVYRSSLYALGEIGGVDGVSALVRAQGRKEREVVGRASLRDNYDTVLLLLSGASEEVIMLGLEAVRFMEATGPEGKVRELAVRGSSSTVRDRAAEVLAELIEKREEGRLVDLSTELEKERERRGRE